MSSLDGKTHPVDSAPDSGDPLGYLRVDAFLKTMLGSCALQSAFDLGVIDALLESRASGSHVRREDVVASGRASAGMQLLLDMLRTNDVIVEDGGRVALTEAFRCALAYRDLMEASLEFAQRAGRDLLTHFAALVADPAAFSNASEVFELFSYDRCVEITPENIARAREWMRITTRLTKYEAGVCMHRFDFSRFRTLLDVGGNSGEFARRICARHATLRATVFDLPVVCELGHAHLAETPEASRVAFVAGDATREAFPGAPQSNESAAGEFDLVTFKSVLHDWPDTPARDFLGKAYAALRPGGTLLIFERSRLDSSRPLPYSIAPLLLFLQAYRPAATYLAMLKELGFTNIDVREVTLEMPFHLITAIKPG